MMFKFGDLTPRKQIEVANSDITGAVIFELYETSTRILIWQKITADIQRFTMYVLTPNILQSQTKDFNRPNQQLTNIACYHKVLTSVWIYDSGL